MVILYTIKKGNKRKPRVSVNWLLGLTRVPDEQLLAALPEIVTDKGKAREGTNPLVTLRYDGNLLGYGDVLDLVIEDRESRRRK
jgi:hypothetical protein